MHLIVGPCAGCTQAMIPAPGSLVALRQAAAAHQRAEEERLAAALEREAAKVRELEELVAAAEAHFGQSVSVVVNNALARYQFNPSSSMASIKTVSTEDLEQQMRGTLAGAVNMVQAALPSFEAAKFGTR